MAEHTIYYSPSFSEATQNATFTREHINAAIGQALNLLKEGKQVGAAKYPHAYKKYPAQTHAQEPVFEFPILLDGTLYKGTHSPGPDRVVFGSVSTDYASADYVGIAGVGPDGVAGAAPSTPGGAYTPHIFRDTSVNRHSHDHGHGHEHEHEHEHDGEGKTVTPPLAPPEARDLITDSDVKVRFLD